MDVVKFELRKIFLSPIVWVLMVGVICLSHVIIVSNTHERAQLRILTDMVATYGTEINEESLAGWRRLHIIELEAINEITEIRMGQSFLSVETLQIFAAENEMSLWDVFIEMDEWQQFMRVSLIEDYLFQAEGADAHYRAIDLNNFGEDLIAGIGASGALAEIIRSNFSAHQETRFPTLVENGEHLHFFFNGHFNQMHYFLFLTVLVPLTLGITIIVALVSAFLFGYEFDHKTSLLAYSTVRGRKLQIVKFKAASIATVIITSSLLLIVLGIFFLIYDYSGLWQVPIASLFTSTSMSFFVPRYSLTFGQYLITVCGLIMVAQFLFVTLIFCLFKLSKNSYLTVIYFIAIAVSGMMAFRFFPLHSRLFYLSGFNPFYMLSDLSASFMIWGVSQTFLHFEIVTIGTWTITLSGLSIVCFQRFKKIDL